MKIIKEYAIVEGTELCKIANQVLDATVTHKGDDFYSVEEN